MYRSFPRRLLYSLLLLLLWLGFVVEGSHALLSDSVTLTGNMVTTGTAVLQIGTLQNNGSVVFSDIQNGFPLQLNPGDSQDRMIYLKNISTGSLGLDLSVQAAITDNDESDLYPAISVEFIPVKSDGTPVGPGVSEGLGTMQTLPLRLADMLAPGATQEYIIRTQLDPTFAFAQEWVGYDLNIEGVQHYAAS